MPTKIEAKEHILGKIFSDDYVFDIPMFQRPYVWEEETVQQLLDDIKNAKEMGGDEPYFLGSIVLVRSDGELKSQVVDGQQRLTTLTMLFCVLRELSNNHTIRTDLDKRVRAASDAIGGVEGKVRLSIRPQDQGFFEKYVQKNNSSEAYLSFNTKAKDLPDSQKNIAQNIKKLHSELEKLDEGTRLDVAKYIDQNCYLVVVSASDVESAYRIFSVMNNRGIPLSPTDILKADVIGKMPSGSQEKYAKRWEDIEVDLGRDNFRELFAHIRTIYRKDKLRGSLQREFQQYVLGALNPQKSVDFFDDVLEPYADVYEIVSEASYASTEDAEKINELLRHLNRLDNFDWIPPAMEYFRRNEGQTSSLIKFTRDLERLAYGLFILRAYDTERIRRYGQVLTAIERGDDLFADNSPLQLDAKEKVDIVEKLDGDIYTQPRITKPLLLRLDSLLADTGAKYDQPVISIEHVLPQNPASDSDWIKKLFPDSDERDQWTHKLANLVLLSRRKNSQASNYEFEKKKGEYFQKNGTTTFALTTQVVNQSKWTPELLKNRQSELVGALKKEWRLG